MIIQVKKQLRKRTSQQQKQSFQRCPKHIQDADSFYEDEKTFDAVLINFIVIGESVSRLTETLKEKENQVPWSKIKALRNIVAHDYFGVDAEEVWQIVQVNLPKLKFKVKSILESDSTDLQSVPTTNMIALFFLYLLQNTSIRKSNI